jgi:hypothetical protein
MDPNKIATRDEAVAYLEKHGARVRCLGPFSRKVLLQRIAQLMAGRTKAPRGVEPEDLAKLLQDLSQYEENFPKACVTAKAGLLDVGDAALSRWVNLNLREPCGNDNLRTVVVNGPLDGQRHEAECPKCGISFVYDAPTFPNLPPKEMVPSEE